ncbi:circularly permuted type 2 ATP-grasp protein [Szabonella alba]|uniref:Circularly permuted type 2 ATP-grasp protein n=1 Tax=Szabonella alba TaxID=2804194 RepID=A0A8K0VAF9_9RHOB|nr:circularly permuted type 2 ATP-grasp protein [Szabonella alba]MBL4916603.1 circularly permuted type 2 ATP-grasp protein [Szabonella alba]
MADPLSPLTVPPQAVADYLSGYHPAPGVADELFDTEGHIRPVWADLVATLHQLTPEQIAARFEQGNQYLRDAGVYFRQYSNDPLQERDWPLSHIPVILHESEWAGICDALAQRADLLELVMADLYGPGRLVSEGHLPADLIAGSREWLRPMVGIAPVGGHFLHLLAFEIGRSPDGSWFVLGDRTQAPSGAGFALENRMATGRIFPERVTRARIQRLAGFFGAFRDAINGLARAQGRGSGAAILTPGISNDTYWEQTYIARYLGMMLLEGEDLLVENGRAMVRTIDGPQPLGVLWRRVDGSFADPLELDGASRIGTPGMVEALRQGRLGLVNALGSGVLEMRAMLAFLPRISKILTGAPLAMPNIATWWCGGEAERAHVRDNAAQMLIGPAFSCDLPFDLGGASALGGTFRGDGRHGTIAEWLEAQAGQLVGQEAVTLSTTPVWDEGRIQPRPMTVRVFAARTAQGWRFMPGGYARIGKSGDATALAMQRGGSVADVWILSDQDVPEETLAPPPQVGEFQRQSPGILPSRAADNLFWLGRYVERGEDVIRLIRALHLRLAGTDNTADPLLTGLRTYLTELGVDPDLPVPAGLLQRIATARGCAAQVRDRFSVDGWAALGDLERTAQGMAATARPGDDTARAMSVLLRKMAGFSGLVHENMYRFAGWRFLSFGRALERADALAALLLRFADIAAPVGSFDIAVEVADSVITHQRRYRVETGRDTVVDLLALDADNPRAILFQIRRLRALAEDLPGADDHGRPGPLLTALLPLEAELRVALPDDLTAERLTAIRAGLQNLSEILTASCLR